MRQPAVSGCLPQPVVARARVRPQLVRPKRVLLVPAPLSKSLHRHRFRPADTDRGY